MLKDDELKELLEPILDALSKLDQELGNDLTQIPQVRLVVDTENLPQFGDLELDEETLHQIEDYIQSYIETEYKPTILH